MQNRQNGRRRRSGGGNNPRPMGQPMGGQSANRLEVRVRGNAHQLHEKYKVMARDAHQAGDRVAAEYYLQHADHYFRVLNDARIRQEEMRARRNGFDRYEEENDANDGDEGADLSDDTAKDGPDESRGDSEVDTGQRDGDQRGRLRSERKPRPVRTLRSRGGDEAPPASDGEEALVAFGRVPAARATPGVNDSDDSSDNGAEDIAPVILALGRDPIDAGDEDSNDDGVDRTSTAGDRKATAAAKTRSARSPASKSGSAKAEPAKAEITGIDAVADETGQAVEKPVRRRGRPRKTPVEPVAEA